MPIFAYNIHNNTHQSMFYNVHYISIARGVTCVKSKMSIGLKYFTQVVAVSVKLAPIMFKQKKIFFLEK